MSSTDQTLTPPREEARPETASRKAVANLLRSLASPPSGDTWRALGDTSESVVGKLARRTGRADE